MDKYTSEWLKKQRKEWRSKALEPNAINQYRTNYNIVGWSVAYCSGMLLPPCLAIERLCCEIERQRAIIEKLQKKKYNGHTR